jgi:hypothetical protein
MNATTLSIIQALPRKPILSPADIAAAYGLATTKSILDAIKTGKLEANMIGGKYIISREAARDYIVSNEFVPDEA